MTNAELAKLQIEKHGRDRYPSHSLQLIKLMEELGELSKAHLRMSQPAWKPSHFANLKSEMADVALALYNLADKYTVDLDAEITRKVEDDLRKF